MSWAHADVGQTQRMCNRLVRGGRLSLRHYVHRCVCVRACGGAGLGDLACQTARENHLDVIYWSPHSDLSVERIDYRLAQAEGSMMAKEDTQELLQEQITARAHACCQWHLYISIEGCGSWSRQPSAQFKNYDPAAAEEPHIIPHEALNILTVPPSPDHLVLGNSLCRLPPQNGTHRRCGHDGNKRPRLQSYPASVGFLAGHRGWFSSPDWRCHRWPPFNRVRPPHASLGVEKLGKIAGNVSSWQLSGDVGT